MAKKTKKLNKKKWFISVRGSYLPNNWKGWLTYIPFTVYLVFTLFVGWYLIDSKVGGVILIVANWAAAAIVMTWVAKRTS